jgi:hypothetical protein
MAAGERQLSAHATSRPQRSPGLAATAFQTYCLLWLITLLAAIVALPLAAQLRGVYGLRLAPAPPGNASIAGLIAANNLREAAIPLLFAALTVDDRRWLALIGDAVVGASLTVNVALGGLALGAYGPALLRYLPQWPLEWGGLAFALTAWRRARAGRPDPCELTLLALGAAMLLCLAALVETYAVPQV